MKRYLFALTLAAAAVAAACFNLSSPVPPVLAVTPVLDSMFVGDTLPARRVVLYDANGTPQPPGTVRWSIAPTSVATIDSVTGQIVGVSKGAALLVARAANQGRAALVIVSRPLELSLLMDTLVLAPGDTISLPAYLAQKEKNPAPMTLHFDPSPTPSVYTIDTITGLVRAITSGGPVRYVARLSAAGSTVADTGGVVVSGLADTTFSGLFYMTATGTAIRHQSGVALAFNYTRLNLRQAFRLVDTLVRFSPDTAYERIFVTLPDSVLAAGTYEIDSINPQEVGVRFSQLDPFCNPRRPWAFWQSILPAPGVRGYAHGTPTDSVAGHLIITRYSAGASGGAIISGRYIFRAQRSDLYYDPLGAETIRGTFVAPLRTQTNYCQG